MRTLPETNLAAGELYVNHDVVIDHPEAQYAGLRSSNDKYYRGETGHITETYVWDAYINGSYRQVLLYKVHVYNCMMTTKFWAGPCLKLYDAKVNYKVKSITRKECYALDK